MNDPGSFFDVSNLLFFCSENTEFLLQRVYGNLSNFRASAI